MLTNIKSMRQIETSNQEVSVERHAIHGKDMLNLKLLDLDTARSGLMAWIQPFGSNNGFGLGRIGSDWIIKHKIQINP